MQWVGTWPVYSLLLWIYPILNLYAENQHRLAYDWMLPALAVTGLAALALLALCVALFRDITKAGLMVALLGLAILYSGQVANASGQVLWLLSAKSTWVNSALLGWVMASMVSGFLGIGVFLIGRHGRRAKAIMPYMSIVTVVLVAMPMLRIGLNALGAAGGALPLLGSSNIVLSLEVDTRRPDIYYIILDGYARDDVLCSEYGFDNADFLQFLEQRGFYVAADSRSNYGQTFLSLASSLNLEHLTPLRDMLGPQSADWSVLFPATENNRLMRTLRQTGYVYVTLPGGWYGSTNRSRYADLQFDPPFVLNEFEVTLLKTTAFRYVLPLVGPANQRAVILYNLEQAARLPEILEPTFTFLHLLVPHPPYLFDRNGAATTPDVAADVNWSNRPAYVQEVEFINRRVEALVEALLARSKTPPIIILQADHGPVAGDDAEWAHPSRGFLKARYGILNAYYLPGGGAAQLYPGITPVNSFRVVLNYYFAAGLELLDDSSYFSTWVTPYNFSQIQPALLARNGPPRPSASRSTCTPPPARSTPIVGPMREVSGSPGRLPE